MTVAAPLGPVEAPGAPVGGQPSAIGRVIISLEVVIGPGTWQAIRHRAVVRALGSVHVRGKEEAVDAFVLERLEDEALAPPRAPGAGVEAL